MRMFGAQVVHLSLLVRGRCQFPMAHSGCATFIGAKHALSLARILATVAIIAIASPVHSRIARALLPADEHLETGQAGNDDGNAGLNR